MGRKLTPEEKLKRSARMRTRWQDPAYKSGQVSKVSAFWKTTAVERLQAKKRTKRLFDGRTNKLTARHKRIKRMERRIARLRNPATPAETVARLAVEHLRVLNLITLAAKNRKLKRKLFGVTDHAATVRNRYSQHC
jgi:hypothetical protein